MPGTYKVSLSKFEDGIITEIAPAVSFNTKLLNADALAESEKKQLSEFSKKVSELRRAVGAADSYRAELSNKMKYIKTAVNEVPQKLENLPAELLTIDKKLVEINTQLNGDATLAKREFETIPSINSRVGSMEYTLWNVSVAPTQTFIKSYDIATSQFSKILVSIKEVDESIKKVEGILEENKAPYTPGRLPNWKGK
jgi:chromosome segregation ATPase